MHASTKALLFQLAEPQHGYFTAWQAVAAGMPIARLPVMSSRGQIEHVSRGVYKLPYYPASDVAPYIEAVLWPQGLIGVASHESALLLHGLSDASSSQIHITVPAAHRVRREIPPHLQVHHADLRPAESKMMNGVPVTSPVRSILDCHRAGMSAALVQQAIDKGRENGKLANAAAVTLMKLVGAELGHDQ